MSDQDYDVIVVGGGPAGSTAAALTAEYGHRVLLLEKERFPRYHIGESLMPFCYFSLERLGVLGAMEKLGFTRKYSVQFVNTDGMQSRPFYFFQHLDHPAATTWQVNRAEFDAMLLRHSEARGVEVRQETRVRDVTRGGDGAVTGVIAEGPGGQREELRGRITIDATGRDAFLQSRNRWRRRDPELNKVSIWTYYRGSKRDEGYDEGATTVAYLPGKGWFWYIPLRDDVVSVGIVAEHDYLFAETRRPEEIFAREIRRNAWIEDHLSTGEQFGQYWTTGEYSYRSEYCAEDGAVLAGDAFAFLDPVFSSGVFLALKSGEMAADAVHAALEAGDVSAARFEDYGKRLCRMIEIMRRLVYAFYDPQFRFGDLVGTYPELRGDLTDCLIGNVERSDFAELQSALKQFAGLPEELDYGGRGLSSRDREVVCS
ncbi:MAG TPA: NAD(P)/FAD-dependent oxidoreductase [Verrucomicrobiales bacterium]|nr:NAD(P)/FAD-dependent oxidoreductase [Verrucomicrobiales bacterium]